jgi:hypothetical protein
MAKQSILWTALANGYSDDGRSHRISLLVSPRLEPDQDPQVLSFPDFIDWPATLSQSRFVVHFGGQPTVSVSGQDFAGPTRVDGRLGRPDSSVWTALIPKNTFVRGFKFRDLTQHAVLSYPAADIDALVRNLYSRLAASALDQLPTASQFIDDSDWSALLNAVARNDEQFTDRRHDRKTGRFTAVRDVRKQFAAFKNHAFDKRGLETDLARMQLFHTPASTPRRDNYRDNKNVPPDDAKSRAEWLGFERAKLPESDDFQNEIDFHQIVAAMNQYPTLLRRLGLVIDLAIARDALAPAADAPLWVEVELPEGAPNVIRSPDVSPRTRAILDANNFGPVSRKSPQAGDFRVANGLLDLDPKTFSFVQSDVDGAGIKVTNFARSLLTIRGNADYQLDPVTKQKRELGAPALRNAGLVLVHNQRAEMLKNAIARQHQYNSVAEQIQQSVQNPPPPPELFAEDLVRGYRIDIWDDLSQQWHSLCQRKARYDIGSDVAVIDVAEEEGTVRLAATTSSDPASNQDVIWLHETLVAWPGWSLCAPPPGLTIGHDPADHSDPVTKPEPEVPPGLRLKSQFSALAGSLPRLRYGRRYWLRARVVDLAGNSLDPRPKDFGPEHAKQNAQPYYRYEPISAPAIALLKRTPATIDAPFEGESMERMAIRSFNDTSALNGVPTPQQARRVAVPSRTTQREAEQHGVLDNGGALDPAVFAMLAAKDYSLAEEKLKSAGPLAGGAAVETGYAAWLDGDALPYLPDPLAVEIAARIFDHPGFPDNKVISIPFYDGTRWPDALPFKIEIYDDPADAPHYDSAVRTLFIPLPKAARCTLRLSVEPSPEALRLLGVWNWLSPVQQTKAIKINGHATTLERLVREGQHWMLTPWRNLELVHAVQRPLISPLIGKLVVDRPDSATFALPNFISACSIASTDRIDLRANWNEPFEDATANLLENRPRVDHAFSVKITDAKAYAGSPDYLLEAPDVIRAGGSFHDRIAKKVHEFHDTRYRRIEYWLEATTKFREFLPADLLTETVGGVTQPTEEHIRIVGTKVRGWIPSSAPPPAPEVLYVVPTFGWVRSGSEASKSSWRRGGGLRVYLNRPWNASGYGEMLGVVLPSATFTGDPNAEPAGQPLKNFVTQWGNDPIWLSPFVAGVAPKPADFALARVVPDFDGKWLPEFAPAEEADQPPGPFPTTGLNHPELHSPTAQSLVDVAPHDVFFDHERQLWYCDIEIHFGAAYFPFIRLALARYQPVALSAAHLSNVVLADFMPLVPDRWLNVTQANDPLTRQVAVFGDTFTGSSSHTEATHAPAESLRLLDGTILDRHAPEVAATSIFEVWVERLDPAMGEDFGWHRDPDALVQKADSRLHAVPASAASATAAKARVRADDLLKHREFEAMIDEGLLGHVFVTPTLWNGTVTLPQSPGETARYRLVIAEFEEYLVDDAMPYDRIPTKKDRRMVFVEHVELP